MIRQVRNRWLAVLAIIAVLAGTFALIWLVWRSPHRNDLATFGSYAAAIVAIALGLSGSAVGVVTRATKKRKSQQGGKDSGRSRSAPEFAHVDVTDKRKPHWKEYDQEPEEYPFLSDKCDRYFYLEDFVYDADLFLDVVLLNRSSTALILSRVGVEILQAARKMYAYGYPKPAKISPATDEYVLQMPDIRELIPLTPGSMMFPMPFPFPVNREVWLSLPDPIYMKAGAPYRYLLRFQNYQHNMPNHARIQLLAEAGGEITRSKALYIFTL